MYGPSYDGVIFATLPTHAKNFCGCIRNDPSLAEVPGADEASNLGGSEVVGGGEQRDGGMVIPLKKVFHYRYVRKSSRKKRINRKKCE